MSITTVARNAVTLHEIPAMVAAVTDAGQLDLCARFVAANRHTNPLAASTADEAIELRRLQLT